MLVQTVVLYVKLPRYRQSAGLPYPGPARLGAGHRARRAGAAPPRAVRRLLVRHVQRPVDDAGLPARGRRRTATATASSASSGSSARPAPSPPRSSAASPTAAGSTGSPAGRAASCSPASSSSGSAAHSLAPLLVGILLLDVGSQGVHISNQSEIYRLRPEARNRINAFYMTSCFVGAAAGSASAAFAYDRWGWAGHLRARRARLARRRRPLGDRPAAAPRREGARPRGSASRMTRKDQA